MLKIFLCILIVCGCGYLGFSISLYYKKREKFFNDFVDFLNYSKTQISFFQNRLIDIFFNFDCSGELKRIINLKAKQIDSGVVEIIKKPSFISDNEWQWIIGFLDNLGKCDVDTEIDNIMSVLEKASQYKHLSKLDFEKKGIANAKLGFAFGLALAIIFI